MNIDVEIVANGWRALLLSVLLLVGGFAFLVGGFALRWGATCGVVKLITMCFGWKFKWSSATAIWLILCLARTVFNNRSN